MSELMPISVYTQKKGVELELVGKGTVTAIYIQVKVLA